MISYVYFVDYSYNGNSKDFPTIDTEEATAMFSISKCGRYIVDSEANKIAEITAKYLSLVDTIVASKRVYITPLSHKCIFQAKLVMKLDQDQISTLVLSGQRMGKEIRRIIIGEMKKKYIADQANPIGLANEIMNNVVAYDINSTEKTPREMLNSKDKIRLYAYQRENIKWMKNHEQRIDNKQIKYTYSRDGFVQIADNLVFSVLDSIFLNGTLAKFETFVTGGSIIDDVGTGKTLTMLGLILSNPDPVEKVAVVEQNHDGEPAKKKLKLTLEPAKDDEAVVPKREIIDNPAHCIALVSKVVDGKRLAFKCTSAIKDKAKNMCSRHSKVKNAIIDENYYADITPNIVETCYPLRLQNDTYPRSRATLIIVPPNLYKQWKAEINTKIEPKPEMIGIATVSEYKNITYGDLLCADIVIVTTNFLGSEPLKTVVAEYCDEKINIHVAKRNCAFEISRNKNLFLQSLPLLNAIHWHRVVLDEAHEEIGDNVGHQFVFDFIMSLETNYRWYMSATPFTKTDALRNFATWISPPGSSKEALFAVMKNAKELFRRNTEASTKEEFKLPPLEEETLWLNFSKKERDIYTSFSKAGHRRELIRQLCCHLKVCDRIREDAEACKTIDDIHKHLVDAQKARVDRLTNELEEIIISIQTTEDTKRRYEQADMRDLVAEQNRILTGLRERKKNREAIIAREQSTMRFLNASVDQLKGIDGTEDAKECGICSDDIDSSDIGMTKCGHLFCYSCLHECIKFVPRCGYCQTPLSGRDIWKVEKDTPPPAHTEVVKNHNEEMQQLDEMIQKHGTKMAHIVRYIKKTLEKTKNEKIIVFSYYDNMLRLVRETLEEAGVETILCTGNVFCRNKAINDFKFDTRKRVILLSAEHSASGANLTQASRIIVVEPLEKDSGKESEAWAEDIERQIVGRAYRMGQKNIVRVVRFLIRDSVEEEIHVHRFGKGSAPPKGNKDAKILKYVNNEELVNQYTEKQMPMDIEPVQVEENQAVREI